MFLKPKNWQKFQHYKDRSPPWIKLHRELLDDREFMLLPIASKALAPLLWLLASESADGTFDASDEELIFRLRVTQKDLTGLRPLIDKGFFTVASGSLAECKQDARPEGEGETEGKLKALSGKPDVSVLEYLNSKTGRAYRATVVNLGFIKARLNEGASVDDCKAVVDRQLEIWRGTDMEQYLRPATLFNREKFNQYVGEIGIGKPGEKPWFINGWSSVVAKGKEHGLIEDEFPTPPEFRSAVLLAAGITPAMIKQAEADWK